MILCRKYFYYLSNNHNTEHNAIFHNAGVTSERRELFYKGKYITKLPYDIKQEDFSNSYCSYKYVENLLKTKEVTCLK